MTKFSNDFNPTNLSNPSSLQINSQPVARGAGGRGEALGSAPTPQGVKGVSNPQVQFLRNFRFLRLRGGPPLPPAPPKIEPKFDQKSNPKKVQIFDPKWPPKGTLKISKMSPNLQNGTLKPFSRALLAAPISERVSKSSPRTSRTSKIIVLLCFQKSTLPSKWSLLDTFWDPFGTTFPPIPSPMAPKVAKKTLSENIKKNYQILRPKLTPK